MSILHPTHRCWLLLVFWLTCLALHHVVNVRANINFNDGDDGDNAGLCNVYFFLPFTNKGAASTSLSGKANRTSPAYAHLAAGLLAMKHFNERNASVVPELKNLIGGDGGADSDWRGQLDFNTSRVFNTDTFGHSALQQLIDVNDFPCAIAGPFNDMPALDLSTIAHGAQIPLVAHRFFNNRVVLDTFSPFSSSVYPDSLDSARVLVQFLIKQNRTNYFSLLYSVTDSNIQRREVLSWALDEVGITWDLHPMVSPSEQATANSNNTNTNNNSTRTIHTAEQALRTIQKRGFRTIVAFLDDPKTEFPAIAEAAEMVGLNNGDYYWQWYGDHNPIMVYSDVASHRKLSTGSALLLPVETFWGELVGAPAPPAATGPDPFYQAWLTQGSEELALLNRMSPLSEGDAGYFKPDDDFFQTYLPEFGT